VGHPTFHPDAEEVKENLLPVTVPHRASGAIGLSTGWALNSSCAPSVILGVPIRPEGFVVGGRAVPRIGRTD